jgi:hypothetical protein
LIRYLIASPPVGCPRDRQKALCGWPREREDRR